MLKLIATEYPHLFILFVPANLTEICQPLDIYFNAEFKTTLASLRNHRAAKLYETWSSEHENNTGQFRLTTEMKTTNQWFYEDLALALEKLNTEEKKKRFREVAFKDLNICYKRDYQIFAMQKVLEDKNGKYFKGNMQDSTLDRFDAITVHEDYPTIEYF